MVGAHSPARTSVLSPLHAACSQPGTAKPLMAEGTATRHPDHSHGEGGFWHTDSLLPTFPVLLRGGAHSLPALTLFCSNPSNHRVSK